jgi:uncharacterized protein
LGFIGGELSISGGLLGIYTIIIAVIMGWLGLSILGLVPSLNSCGIRTPLVFSKYWNLLKQSRHPIAPMLLGSLSFFLPCGFTQSMQLFAIASGSAIIGGLSLFLFALGTLPILLAAGVASSWTRSKRLGVLQKAAGIVVLLFAITTLQSGLLMRQIKGNVFSSGDPATTEKRIEQKGNVATDEQTVVMHVTRRGFEPDVFKIKAGVPIRWVIKGDQVTGCTNKVIVPELGIEKSLKTGDTIIRFVAPQKKGTIAFSCWMGMVQGSFVVE